MAVAFNAVGAGDEDSLSSTSITISWSHTCTDSNRAVTVGFTSFNSGQSQASQTRTVTYGGVGMTQLVSVDIGSNTFTEIWGMLNPSTGAQTALVQISSGSSTSRELVGNSVSYTGVNSFGANATNTGSSTTSSVTISSVIDEMVSNAIGTRDKLHSAYTKTQRYNNGGAGADVVIGDAAGAASVNFQSTLDVSGAWGSVAVRIVPSTSAGAFFQFF
jgi:hypothetical protein